MSEINLSLHAPYQGPPFFQEIFQRAYEPTFQYVYNIIKNQVDAEDITIETFVKLWKQLASQEQIQNPDGFLHTTAKNACIDYIRGNQRRKMKEGQVKYLLQHDDPSSEVTTEALHLLYDKLQKLPEQPRTILKLYLEGLPHSAIAAYLGITTHHVSVQKRNGIKQLRAAMLKL